MPELRHVARAARHRASTSSSAASASGWPPRRCCARTAPGFAEAPRFCPICGSGYDPAEVHTLSDDGADRLHRRLPRRAPVLGATWAGDLRSARAPGRLRPAGGRRRGPACSGGYTNEVWRVGDLVVKRYDRTARPLLFGNDPLAEARALAVLASRAAWRRSRCTSTRRRAWSSTASRRAARGTAAPSASRGCSADVHATPGHGFRTLPDRRRRASSPTATGSCRSSAAARSRGGGPQAVRCGPVARRLVHRDAGPGNLIDVRRPAAADRLAGTRRRRPGRGSGGVPLPRIPDPVRPRAADGRRGGRVRRRLPDAARRAAPAAHARLLRLADGGLLRLAGGAARRRRPGRERGLHAGHRRAARAAVKRYLQSYSLRHHYDHAPGYDVFAFLERAAAAGYDGVSINVNGPGYRQLSGTAPAHVARVRQRLDELGLGCDLETSGTAPDASGGADRRSARRSARGGFAPTCGTRAASPTQVARTTADLRAAAPACAARGVDGAAREPRGPDGRRGGRDRRRRSATRRWERCSTTATR